MTNSLIKILYLLPLFTSAACAVTLPQERRDYIEAQPHGWFELIIEDEDVPAVGISENGKTLLAKPLTCTVSILANSELVLNQQVYPHGGEAPYSVNSGFRFPLSVGDYELELSYSGCKIDKAGEADSRAYKIELNVATDMVYEVTLNQEGLTALIEKTNGVVTLRQLLDALEGS